MGVKGLTSFVENHRGLCSRRHFRVDREPSGRHQRCLLVVDGPSLLQNFYPPKTLDWTCGGEWVELQKSVRDFVHRFRRAGFDLVVIFDGAIEKSKRDTWSRRRLQEQSRAHQIFNVIIDSGKCPDSDLFFIPAGLSTHVRAALKSECVVLNSFGEADREIAQYSIDHNAYGVLGQDSDYFIYPLRRHFGTKELHVQDKEIVMVENDLRGIADLLGLDVNRLPVFAALCGNDVLNWSKLESFHRCITGKSRPNSIDVIKSVAKFVAEFPSSATDEQIGKKALGPTLMGLFRNAVAMYDLMRESEREHTDHSSVGISAAVVTLARERHRRAEIIHLVYPLILTREIDFGSTLEDPSNRCDLPAESGLLLRPIRRRVYGILFGLRKGQSPAVAVHEWCVHTKTDLRQPEVVYADPVPSFVTSLDNLWLGPDWQVKEDRMKTFLYCMGWEWEGEFPLRGVRPHYIILCVVLRFLFQEYVLWEFEFDAFLAQAVDLANHRTSDLKRMRSFSCLDGRAVQLGAVFMRAVYVATFAYNSCGMVLDDSVTSPWHYFDGVLFHCKYLESQRGTPLKNLCRYPEEFLFLKKVVTRKSAGGHSSRRERFHSSSLATGKLYTPHDRRVGFGKKVNICFLSY